MDVAWRIKELIAQSGLSQAEIAKQVGFSQQYISAVANGKKIPLDNLEKLCTGLNITISDFFQPFSTCKTESHVPDYLNDFVALCLGLESEDIQVLSMTVKHIKNLRKAAPPPLPTAEPVRKAVLEKSPEVHSPVNILGEAAAGFPLYNEAESDDVVELPSKYADPEHYRIIRARGDSMEPKIYTGDIVIAEIDVAPYEGQMALVHLAGLADDEYTIKRVYHDKGLIILRSYNSAYPDMKYSPEDIRSCEAVVDVLTVGGLK